jgi:DNA-directed RNA polymerase subunit K/omega
VKAEKQPEIESKSFFIDSPTFLARREIRQGESEHQIRRDIETFEPWRLPVTITEVTSD